MRTLETNIHLYGQNYTVQLGKKSMAKGADMDKITSVLPMYLKPGVKTQRVQTISCEFDAQVVNNKIIVTDYIRGDIRDVRIKKTFLQNLKEKFKDNFPGPLFKLA